jgi:hypothetical protein
VRTAGMPCRLHGCVLSARRSRQTRASRTWWSWCVVATLAGKTTLAPSWMPSPQVQDAPASALLLSCWAWVALTLPQVQCSLCLRASLKPAAPQTLGIG